MKIKADEIKVAEGVISAEHQRDLFDAARWRFMMKATHDVNGAEYRAMEEASDELDDGISAETESEFEAVVDAAILKIKKGLV